jgi:hypothetical protein
MKRIALLAAFFYTWVSYSATFTVTNTADSGPGSLRQAIADANADITSPTIVNFNISPGGLQTIIPTTFYFNDPMNIRSFVYEPLQKTITIDATTQPGYSPGNPQVDIDCSVIAAMGKNGNCLTILGSDNCVIKGLHIHNYVGSVNGRGISIQNTVSHGVDSAHITQCRLGSLGLFGNTRGIVIDGGASTVFPITNALIGGPSVDDGNVLSGNSISGIAMQFNIQNTIIQNNRMGCDKTGTVALGNAYGIVVSGAAGNPVTETQILDNIIAGNGIYNIVLQINTNDSLIQNNKIGTNITGNAALGNAFAGILVASLSGATCEGNLIEENIISGNNQGGAGIGIFLVDNVNNNQVQSNLIGTNSTGTAAIPNGYGIVIQGDTGLPADGNSIGGTTADTRNIIAGNTICGIFLNYDVKENIIQNNYIGTDITGLVALSNELGIALQGDVNLTVSANIIGGSTASVRNIVSGNTTQGIWIGNNATQNKIQGNYIGVAADGITPLPNNVGITTDPTASAFFRSHHNFSADAYIIETDSFPATSIIRSPDVPVITLPGIIFSGLELTPFNNLIGGPLAGQGNIISGNTTNGIQLLANALNNLIIGNIIGSDATTLLDIGNGSSGILIQGSNGFPATGNNIIGTDVVSTLFTGKNVIKFNGNANPPGYGVEVNGDDTTPDILNAILNNSIFANNNNGIKLLNNGNNLQEGPTLISAHLCGNGDQLVITGTAPENPIASNFRLEFFINTINNNPITEGETYVGALAPIESGEYFSIVLPISVTPGMWLSATATNLNNNGEPGDTSEFTLNIPIDGSYSPLSATLTAAPTTIIAGNTALITTIITGDGPFTLTWSDGLIETNVMSPAIRAVSPTVNTSYSVLVTDVHGCSFDPGITINITVLSNAESDLTRAIRAKYCSIL